MNGMNCAVLNEVKWLAKQQQPKGGQKRLKIRNDSEGEKNSTGFTLDTLVTDLHNYIWGTHESCIQIHYTGI